MGCVYVYGANADDFSTIGICGALTPKTCRFHEIANGASTLEMEHPKDALGRYACLIEDRVLKCDVPVRTTPEIANGAFVTVIEQYTVRSTATKADRYIYNKADPSASKQAKLVLVPVGATVSIIAKYAESEHRWKCTYSWTEKKNRKTVHKTVTGYIAHDSNTLSYTETVTVTDASTGIEAVAPSWRIKEQLFRITSVRKKDKAVYVEASHISYDMLHNLTTYDESGSKTLQQAASGMLDACLDPHQATFQTNLGGAKQGFHFRDKDPITALLDPDIGLIPRWGGELIRDNYEFTVLDHAGVNRGMIFSYGKNIRGVEVKADFSGVATAIRPVGETEAGKPVYLEHSYLWDGTELTALSDTNGIVYGRWHVLRNGSVECLLSHARIYPITGEDCKENKSSGPNLATVRSRLLDQAVAQLAGGAENPAVSVDVDIQLLGYTEQWSQYREIEQVFLFDTVRVRHPDMRIDLETPICEMEWDCLNDMPLKVKAGIIDDLTSSIASWQINSLNGAKLTPGSVAAGQLADGAIATGHLQAGAVTADILAANSVTANKLDAGTVNAHILDAVTAHINSITAQSISTNSLSAAVASLLSVVAGEIEAGRISTGQLAAVVADVMTITARTGDFDFATVSNLVSSSLTLQQGQADSMYITNLAITSANLLNATIGKLILKGNDGKYYSVSVGSDGVIHTEEVALTQAEIADGQSTEGRQIVDETVNADSINGRTIKASEAILGSVLTEALNAGQITATEAIISSASIPMLYTTSISALGESLDLSANRLIEMLVGVADDIMAWFSFTPDGLITRKSGSKWSTRTDADGYYIDHDDVYGHVGAFHHEILEVRGVQIGSLIARPTSSGGWVWTDE